MHTKFSCVAWIDMFTFFKVADDEGLGFIKATINYALQQMTNACGGYAVVVFCKNES
jgi:hypothetical protein